MPTRSHPEPDADVSAWVDELEQRAAFVLPPVPDDLAGLADDDGFHARLEASHAFALLTMTAEQRFAEEHGEPLAVAGGSTTEEVAVVAQAVAVQAGRVFAIAEAQRIVAVLEAYERSIVDLAARFGRDIGTRAGLGAQAFFKSMGLQLGVHPFRLAHEVDTATVLRARLPRTWAVFLAGATSWSRVNVAARMADGLDEEHLPVFDERAAAAVVRSTRLKDDLRKTRERLQADTAAARARRTLERRTTTIELGHDGEASLVLTGPATDWVPRNDALHRAAVAAHGVAGESRSIAVLRHDIALDILDEGLKRYTDDGASRVPLRKPVAVTLVLTVPALGWLGRTTEQAVLGGYGPIAMETAKALAGQARSFIRVLTDPVTGARLVMDQKVYAPPTDLARWVRIRDGRSRFPGATRPAHLCDIDHARERQHGGPTNADNLITLDRPNHNLKSAGLFEEALLDTGAVGWNDAWDHRFEDPPDDPLDPAPPDLLPNPPPDDEPCPF